METIEEIHQSLPIIEEKVGYLFQNKALLILAFIHRSFFNENRDVVEEHNERLEFLGDSVLGLIISTYLYQKLPQESEGRLSHLRSHLIDADTCCQFLYQLNLSDYVLLGKGERSNEGRGRETILADLFEAVMGAIYLDGGLEAAKNFFFSHFEKKVDELLHVPVKNWKAEFQDYAQKNFQVTPTYRVVQEVGPDHQKSFVVEAMVGERVFGQGEGGSKKEAEIRAAHVAMQSVDPETE